MNGRHKVLAISIPLALLATTLGAAGVGAQSAKEGNAVPPVSLELAVAEWAGSSWVDSFAAKVDELSGGSMRIDIDWEGGSEAEVPSLVQAGDADLGWVYARGLNAAEVHDLDALLTPFLVSDHGLLNEVITGPIGADMLAGLADDDLEGLALLPGDQRYFVGIGRPLATPADLDGARIAMVRTPFLDRLVESLGAEPVAFTQDDPAAYEQLGVDGIITVAGNLALFPDTFMTSNLVPYTVPTIVLANAEAMAELEPEQQAILHAAAVDLRDQLLAERPDVESSAARCGIGASVIEASDADAGAIAAATKPVREWLASDPTTAAFIERIEALKADLPASAYPAACGAPVPAEAAAARIPDGTYRAVATRQDALRTGWESECDLESVDEHGALVVSEGGEAWTSLGACGDETAQVWAAGTFEYTGDQLVMREPGIPGQASFAWSVVDGELALRVLETVDEYAPLSALQYIFEREFTLDPPATLARIPDGTYTTAVTKADAVRTGFKDICTLNDKVKTVTLVVEDDRFTEMQACEDGPTQIGSEGRLEYADDRVVFAAPDGSGEPTFAWSVDEGTLSLRVVDPADDAELAVLQFLFEHEFAKASS